MAESSNQGKRKKKSKKFYGGGKKGKYENVIKAGMRGVLVFGADNEAKARREAYNLLNEYADELFGTEFTENISCDVDTTDKDNKGKKEKKPGDGEKLVENEDIDSSSENEEDVDDDIEKAIAKEIKQIKSLKKSRRFQNIPTDIAKTKQNKARSFQRLVPITNVCTADLVYINKIVSEQFLPGDDTKGCVSICVQYKSRFNSSLKRNDVVSQVSSQFLNTGHKVDLKNPDMVIVVEIMKGLCFMNILKDFFHFKKYNLHQIANTKAEDTANIDNAKDNVEGDSAEGGS